jgi:hypothetical protein
MTLNLHPNLQDPDAIYEKMIAMVDNHDPEAAARCSARLILLLANHIGDAAVIEEAIRRATQSAEETQ